MPFSHRLQRSALLCTLLAACAAASSAPAEPTAYSLHLGSGDRYQRITLGAESAPVWSKSLGWGRVDVVGEFGASYWRADAGGADNRLWQLSAIPIARWWPTERFYLEAGIGATLIDRTRFAGKELSTAFQFGDHLGLGWQFTPTTRVGVRVSHFSNAAIKRPNSGLDIYQLTLTQQF